MRHCYLTLILLLSLVVNIHATEKTTISNNSTPASTELTSGVKGRVAWRGELVPDVRISAYTSLADIAAGRPISTSAPADLDGTYNLALPLGKYHLIATTSTITKIAKGELNAGDYFCYYSGSPIHVTANSFTNVGFNLIKVPDELIMTGQKRSGITGQIHFQETDLEQVYLYVYKDDVKEFKGPAYHILPVEKGTFRMRLPPGTYYLMARKRAKGGMFGPIEIGDYFNYYHGNPVTITEGTIKEIKLETITRLSMLEDDETAKPTIKGKVIDASGSPLSGMYIFAYEDKTMTGTPTYFSSITEADGSFELQLPIGETFYLLTRQSFGGPAGQNELYGRFGGDTPSPVKLIDKTTNKVVIHAAKNQLR